MPSGHCAKILGCMLGNAIWDAFGGAVEFKSAQRIREMTGGTSVEHFLPYPQDHGAHPLGVWVAAPGRGAALYGRSHNVCHALCA